MRNQSTILILTCAIHTLMSINSNIYLCFSYLYKKNFPSRAFKINIIKIQALLNFIQSFSKTKNDTLNTLMTYERCFFKTLFLLIMSKQAGEIQVYMTKKNQWVKEMLLKFYFFASCNRVSYFWQLMTAWTKTQRRHF